jgi:hypothetical protein
MAIIKQKYQKKTIINAIKKIFDLKEIREIAYAYIYNKLKR